MNLEVSPHETLKRCRTLLNPIRTMQTLKSDRNLGMMAIALAAILWAMGGNVASELFQSGMRPFELATMRALIAAIGLGLITQCWNQSQGWLRDQRMLLLGLSIALVTFTYYVAIARLSVAVAIVIQYTAPALVVIWGMLQSLKVPARSVLTALTTAIVGVVLIAGVFSGEVRIDGLGFLMAGLSAFFFASYTLLSESVVATYGAMGVMFRAFSISSLFWLTFQVAQGWPSAVFVPQHVIGILFVGIGGTLMPFSLYCWGIERVKAERAAIAATLEPVVAAVIAWIHLGQMLTPIQVLGGLLVIFAVVALQINSKNH